MPRTVDTHTQQELDTIAKDSQMLATYAQSAAWRSRYGGLDHQLAKLETRIKDLREYIMET